MVYSTVADQNKGIILALATTPLTLDQIVATNEGLSPTANPEWLLNPSFEVTKIGGTTFAYWTDTLSNGSVTRATAVGEFFPDSSRLASCKLTAGAAIDTHTTQAITGLIPGRTYVLSGQGRGDGTHAGRIRIQNSANVDLIPFGTSLTTTATSFTSFSFTFIGPADGAATLSLYCPATNGGVAWFDKLSLIRA